MNLHGAHLVNNTVIPLRHGHPVPVKDGYSNINANDEDIEWQDYWVKFQ